MMKVRDMMTGDPACCTAETSLPEVARMMVDRDCGEIPVVDNTSSKVPIGVVTDRDIVCRTVANGLNPLDLTAADCMSKPTVTVTPEMSLEECCRIMEDKLIRRVPVVDDRGRRYRASYRQERCGTYREGSFGADFIGFGSVGSDAVKPFMT